MTIKHDCRELLDAFEHFVRQDERRNCNARNPLTKSERNQLSMLRQEIKILLKTVCDNVDES